MYSIDNELLLRKIEETLSCEVFKNQTPRDLAERVFNLCDVDETLRLQDKVYDLESELEDSENHVHELEEDIQNIELGHTIYVKKLKEVIENYEQMRRETCEAQKSDEGRTERGKGI